MTDDVAPPIGQLRPEPVDDAAERRPTPMPIHRPMPFPARPAGSPPLGTGGAIVGTGSRTSMPASAPSAPCEDVARGVLFALAVVPLGMIASVLVWKLGFVSAFTSFFISAGAVWLYAKGAGAPPRRGLVAVVGVILVGVVLSFLACVAIDLSDYWAAQGGAGSGEPRIQFVLDNVFRTDVIASYGQDLVMYVLFAALGTFGTLRQLMGKRRRS